MSTDNGSILEFVEDLADAEAPKALPANDYVATVIQADIGDSSKGKKQVAVQFRIAPEDFPADYEDADAFADGKTVTTYVSAEQDKASRFRLRTFCEAIGAEMGKTLDVNDWIGKEAVLTIVPDEYEGVERERVRKVSAK